MSKDCISEVVSGSFAQDLENRLACEAVQSALLAGMPIYAGVGVCQQIVDFDGSWPMVEPYLQQL